MMTSLKKLRRKVRGTLLRLEDRNLSTLVKLAEIRLLGKHASTYCYNTPSHVLIELTAKCNLRCVWCQQSDADWRKRNWSQMDLDDAKRVLTMNTRGPSFTDPNVEADYQDIIELNDDGSRVFRSQCKNDDGSWTEFMRGVYHRKG